MKHVYRLLCTLLILSLVACKHSYTSQQEICQRLIPQPKEITLLDSTLHPIHKVTIDTATHFTNPDEYLIRIKHGKVKIQGNAIWAQHTLRQLQGTTDSVPDITIHDWSVYPIRAFMHDCGRNYQPIEMLERTIDLMSFYKLNYFHWHLTDNPAWRIECKTYPELNNPANHQPGRDEGKYYTYDEIRHFFTYAAERGITIIPEIDMPGHSRYFNNTFGFAMNSPHGMKIIEQLLNEFFDEIPQSICPYFHIGSDEIHIYNPEEFMQFAERITREHHRIALAWDPGLPASATTIRQIWNEADGNNAAETKKGGKYLDSFIGYLNYYDPLVYTNRLFLHRAGAQATPDTSRCLGGDLCLWNDVRVDDKENIALHNGMVTGIMAFSERFWNGGDAGQGVINDNVLPAPTTEAGKNLAAFEQRIQYHKTHLLPEWNIRWVPNTQLHWNIHITSHYPIEAWGGAIDLEALCRANHFALRDTMEAIATTTIIVPADTTITAWVGFETIARSNRISTGIGPQGKWENDGQLLLNGKQINPPTQWQEPGKYNYHYNTWLQPEEEQPFTDEQFYWMRTPVTLPLHAGTNTIQMHVKKQFYGHRWSFALVPLPPNANL